MQGMEEQTYEKQTQNQRKKIQSVINGISERIFYKFKVI